MPIFQNSHGTLRMLGAAKFPKERQLQELIEQNLETLFGTRLIKSEFSTGSEHGGRIDSLGLSEENHPVIIEYKNLEHDGLVSQALFYLSWLLDHRGDFVEAARATLGEVEIDWSAVRVICIAPSYSRYSLHAVKQMSVKAELELWQFSSHQDGIFQLEKILHSGHTANARPRQESKAPVVSDEPDKQEPIPTVEQHRDFIEAQDIRDAFDQMLEEVSGLSEAVEIVPRSVYLAFKSARNFATLQAQKKRLLVYLHLNPKNVLENPVLGARDVTNIGHFGTGDVEIRINSPEEVPIAMALVRRAFDAVGGA